MKKLIYIFTMIIATLTLSSCEEKRWQESDLSETEVMTATILSTDTEAYYFYPEYQFFIYEYNVNLNRYDMLDWNYSIEDDKDTITFKRVISDSEYAMYEIIYSSSIVSGRLTIKYFEDDIELTSNESVLTLSSLSTTTEYIDLN